MDDAIDRLLTQKNLTRKVCRIKIGYTNMPTIGAVEVHFEGFIPTEKVLEPFRKLLTFERFHEFDGQEMPKNSVGLFVPVEKLTAKEVADALTEVWQEQGFEVKTEEQY